MNPNTISKFIRKYGFDRSMQLCQRLVLFSFSYVISIICKADVSHHISIATLSGALVEGSLQSFSMVLNLYQIRYLFGYIISQAISNIYLISSSSSSKICQYFFWMFQKMKMDVIYNG